MGEGVLLNGAFNYKGEHCTQMAQATKKKYQLRKKNIVDLKT